MDASHNVAAPRHATPTAPGWPEMLAGGAAYGLMILLVVWLLPGVADPAVAGVVGLLASGVMGLVALAVAVLIRIRGLAAFGFRRARPRHLVIGAVLGVVAFVLGVVVAVIYTAVTSDAQNVQASYQAAASAGWWSLVLGLIAGAILTPVGEEAFFRGVVANALLTRYGPWVGIIGSAAVFAIAHGINPVLPVAFVVGVLTALLYRASGSIWPGVVLHGTNNAIAFVLPVIVGLATS